MGRDKLLLDYQGKSLLRHSLDLLSNLPVHEHIVITSQARSESLIIPTCLRLCINRNPEKGLSESIKIGVNAASGTHYLFMTADQPKLRLSDLMQLLYAAESNKDKIIFPIVDFKPTTPTIFPESFRKELLALTGDTGGREIRDANPGSCMELMPENPMNFTDIDREEEYHDLF